MCLPSVMPIVKSPGFRHWAFIISLIYLGTLSYTVAAFYHLKIPNWSFAKAFALAIPLVVLVEYQFSLRGNHAARDILGLNAVQITLITMTFYYVNSWMLNHFVLKQPVVVWRELVAFALVIAAFAITTAPPAQTRGVRMTHEI